MGLNVQVPASRCLKSLETDVTYMRIRMFSLPVTSLTLDVQPAFAVVTPEELSDQNTVRLSVMLLVSVLTSERF